MRKPVWIILLLGALLAGPMTFAAEETIAPLVQALKTKDPAAQMEALTTIWSLGPDAADAVPALRGMLKSESAEVRAHAARALGAVGDAAKPAVKALASVIADDENAMVRREAALALERIRPGPKVMLPILAKLLDDPHPAVRARVLSALAERGPEAKELLIQALKNDETAYWACLVISEIGPAMEPAVPALTELLDHEDPAVQREAIIALAAIGSAAAPAVSKLETRIDDPIHGVPAIYALGSIGKVSPEGKSRLVAKAEQGEPVVRTVSAWALAKLHPEDERFVRRAVKLLVEALQSEDPQVRLTAAKALESLDGKPEIVRPIMLEALENADHESMLMMLDALATLGPEIVPRLVQALEIEAARPYVSHILGQLGEDAAPAVDALARLANDANPETRHEAIMALAEIGPAAKAAVPALAEAVRRDEKERFAAAYALGRIGPDAIGAKPALLARLESDDASLALVSAWALARIDPGCPECCAKAVPILIEGLRDEDPRFRKEAASGLICFGKGAAAAGEALKQALNDPDEDVRAAVAEALEAIGR